MTGRRSFVGKGVANCLLAMKRPSAVVEVPTPSVTNPPIHLVYLELPQPPYLVSRHVLALDPLVDGIPLYPQISRDLVDGQPAVFDCLAHRPQTGFGGASGGAD